VFNRTKKQNKYAWAYVLVIIIKCYFLVNYIVNYIVIYIVLN